MPEQAWFGVNGDRPACFVDGRRLPSVGRILRAVGITHLPPAIEAVQLAMARGRRVHSYAHQLDDGILDWSSVSEKDAPFVHAYESWLTDSGAVIIANEQPVVSPTNDWWGRLDKIALIDGAAHVLDLKTRARRSRVDAGQFTGYRLQLSGYQLALPEPHRRLVLVLRADGTAEPILCEDDEGDAADFLAAVRVYRRRERDGLLEDE